MMKPCLNVASCKHLVLISLSALLISSCGTLQSSKSPDVSYDRSAEQARTLQIPPDLTEVSNTEQFVVPGDSDRPLGRNTLLPEFANARFERAGQQSWLAFDLTPEEIWPQLLAFLKNEKYLIFETDPPAGLIVTQWRPVSAVAKGNLLQNLIGGDEQYSRIQFRLERSDSGARLFARSQTATEEVATSRASNAIAWPTSSHDPEFTSEVLSRMLVFFGVAEQKARGIINDEQASMIIDDALVVSTGSGHQLIVQRGFTPTFNALLNALDELDYPVMSSDDGVGRIEFSEGDKPRVLELTPQHVSEVRVALSTSEGRRLLVSDERELLDSLLEKIVQG